MNTLYTALTVCKQCEQRTSGATFISGGIFVLVTVYQADNASAINQSEVTPGHLLVGTWLPRGAINHVNYNLNLFDIRSIC